MRITVRYFSVLLLTALFLGKTAVINAQEHNSATRPGVADMLELVTPAVVNIAVAGHEAMPQNPLLNDPFFRRFFEEPNQQQSRPTMSVGSGVIIDADKGYVLTNNHVVANADQITVTLQDKRDYVAKLIGRDEGTDIALLQISADQLTALPISDSSTLRVGDLVLAIGNPFGIGQTVTTGIISALGRSGISSDGYEDFIQTDASINPGNSGGALVDYNGELLGINSAIIAPAGGNVGIGFAVPIRMAMSVVDQLLEFGEVKRGLLGVEIADLTPDIAAALDLKIKAGAVIQRVSPNSAAANAGLLAGDIIVAVNGESIDSGTDLRNTIGLIRAGTQVQIELVRDASNQTVKATIGGKEETPVAAISDVPASYLDGVELAAVPQSSSKTGGVLVASVDQSSKAWQYGLRDGDVITAVNRRGVNSPAELQKQLGLNKGAVALNIIRDGQGVFLILR